MALYKRWVDLKNKVCGREFVEHDETDISEGKENTAPNFEDDK
jgi:hypothetical protein